MSDAIRVLAIQAVLSVGSERQPLGGRLAVMVWDFVVVSYVVAIQHDRSGNDSGGSGGITWHSALSGRQAC